MLQWVLKTNKYFAYSQYHKYVVYHYKGKVFWRHSGSANGHGAADLEEAKAAAQKHADENVSSDRPVKYVKTIKRIVRFEEAYEMVGVIRKEPKLRLNDTVEYLSTGLRTMERGKSEKAKVSDLRFNKNIGEYEYELTYSDDPPNTPESEKTENTVGWLLEDYFVRK